MSEFLDLDRVEDAVVTQLQEVEGLHRITVEPDEEPVWVTQAPAVPLRSHALVSVAGFTPQQIGVGPQFLQVYEVVVEVWMPRSRERPASRPAWRSLLAGIARQFTEHRSLGGKVHDARLPAGRLGYRPFEQQETGGVVCHYARLTVLVQTYEEYQTR